jgi:hypothetical protein
MTDFSKGDKNVYGIPFKKLENINDIIQGKYHYNYKDVNFMFNWKENSEKLVILFHGAIRKEDSLPMFLKQNYEKNDVSLLTISDKLLEYTKNRSSMYTRTTHFTETKDIKLNNIYSEIIQKSIDVSKNSKIIFLGPCSGSRPAIYFGSIFNANIVILNGWIYVSDDSKKLFEKSSGIENCIKYDIEEIIIKSKPKHIKIYINKQDNMTFNMNLKFINFCKKNIPDNFDVITFDHIKKLDGHTTFFPEEENFDTIIKNA